MDVITARKAIIKHLIGCPDGQSKSNDCEAAVVALAKDDAERKAAKFAFNNGSADLKARGCFIGVSRGVWQVTDAGRKFDESGVLPPRPASKDPKAPKPEKAAKPPKAPKPEKAAKPPKAPKVAKAPEMAKAETTTPEAAAPGDGAEAAPETPAEPKRLKVASEVPAWLNDEQLRGMVIENSECYGTWSAKSQACEGCPLAGWCRNAKAATLEVLAAKIKVPETTAATPAPVAKSVAKLDATVSKSNAPAAPRVAATADAKSMRATFDGTCAATGKPIKKGDLVKYIQGTGIVLV